VLSASPWVALVEGALRDDEIAVLLRERAWERASDAGGVGEDGRSKMVFSANRDTDVHWCKAGCSSEPAVRRLISRLSELLMVHPDYFEALQLLRYRPGQYYRTHHDASSQGSRVYTAFLYLSDVAEGGETHFPRLNISVRPSRGSMLLWPSVLDADPTATDWRTEHGALPVRAGVKYSANVWVHLGPHVLAHNLGCDQSPIAQSERSISGMEEAGGFDSGRVEL